MEGDFDEEQNHEESFAKMPLINSSKESLLQSSNIWSMVSIKDPQDSSLIFPPINHENLNTIQLNKFHPASFMLYPPSSSPTSSSLSTSSVDNDVESSDSTLTMDPSSSDENLKELGPGLRISSLRGTGQWINFWLGVLYRKVRVGFLSFQSSSWARCLGPIAVMMGFLYIRFRKRLRRPDESSVQLRRLIREKDERINQLLHQIAQMNELLLVRK